MKHFLYRVWRYMRWPLLVLVLLYVGLVLWRLPLAVQRQQDVQTIAYIKAQHITMADVMGTNLPPQPYAPENDATVAGIDKNNNGIRDDVELAIFAKYPNSARVRAAELQYAMTEQMFLTQVTDMDTWVAVANQDSRAYDCVSETYPRENMTKYIQITDGYINEVEAFVFNTQARKDAKDKAFEFTTSYGEPDPVPCDIDLQTLPN